MMAEAATVEGIMRNRTLVGVDNGCRYYVPPGRPPSDRGASYPGCHWYLEANVTIPWAAQVGLPGAGSEFAWDTTGQEEAYVWGDWFSSESRPAAALAASALDQILARGVPRELRARARQADLRGPRDCDVGLEVPVAAGVAGAAVGGRPAGRHVVAAAVVHAHQGSVA